MATNSTLLQAILAMDAYNQGYDPGVLGVGNQIGEAVRIDTALPSGAQAAGFYAAAYALADGSRVISYRGTDDLLLDPFTGWGVAFGSTTNTQ
jgi:hypothetical protein